MSSDPSPAQPALVIPMAEPSTLDIAGAREALADTDLRLLGVPDPVMSNSEFYGALHRDRSDALDPDGSLGLYDRRGLLNVIAWLVQRRPSDYAASQLRCQTITNAQGYGGTDEIAQCWFYSGHVGPHWFGGEDYATTVLRAAKPTPDTDR